MAYRCTAIRSVPRAVLVTSVIGLTFLPVARFPRWLFSRCPRCSLPKAACPDKVRACPGVPPSFCLYDPRGKLPRVTGTPTSLVVNLCAVSFSVSEGADHSTMSRLMKVPTICFATSSSTVFLKVLLSVVQLLRRGSCLLLRHVMPLLVVLSFLRRICSLEPRFLTPLMPSGFVWCLFPNIRPFWVLATALTLITVPCAVREWHGGSTVLG
jgi:hypothetical protein